MLFRLILAVTCIASLSACGPDTSPLEREQYVKLTPADTYAVLKRAARSTENVSAGSGMSIVSSANGSREVRIGYRVDGREVITQTFTISDGRTNGESLLRMSFSPAPTATPEERLKFALIKLDQSRRFDSLGDIWGSGTMYSLFYRGEGMQEEEEQRVSLSGKAPVGQNPVASAEASAPEMSAAPTLDPTATVR